jgi:hypothetical protein
MRTLTLLILTYILASFIGCSQTEESLIIMEMNNERNPLLYSELSTLTETSFTGEFVCHNKLSKSLSVYLKKTDCGCLSLRKDGNELKQGDCFTISRQGQTKLIMTMQIPYHPGVYQYGATFEVVDDKEHRSEVGISMKCSIFDDISINPNVVQLTFDKTTDTNRSVTVSMNRISRNTNDLQPPVWGTLPDYLVVQKVSNVSNVVQIAKGIWQKEWQIDLNIAQPQNMGIIEAPHLITGQVKAFVGHFF